MIFPVQARNVWLPWFLNLDILAHTNKTPWTLCHHLQTTFEGEIILPKGVTVIMKYCCCSISSSAIISCCIPVKSKIQKYTKDYILLTSFFQEKDVHAFPRMLKIDLLLDHSPIPDGDLLTTATFCSRPCAKVLKLYFVLFFCF